MIQLEKCSAVENETWKLFHPDPASRRQNAGMEDGLAQKSFGGLGRWHGLINVYVF